MQKRFCGLCGNRRELRKSHFIPAALFKLCMKPGQRSPHPVQVSERLAMLTPKQPAKPFLCQDCEQRFSAGGEKLVIDNCLRAIPNFSLRDSLRAMSPQSDITSEGEGFWGSEALGADLDKYIYFAASVFWRGSVTTWQTMDGKTKRNPLGAKYEEEFRRFLLGKSKFPPNAALWMIVSDDDDLEPIVLFPFSQKKLGFHIHTLYIPGIEFRLLVGGQIPVEFTLRGERGLEVCVFLESFRNSKLYENTIKMIQGATPKRGLRNRKTRVRRK